MSNEHQRLAALQAYQVLDTAHEEAFDRLAELASEIFDAPIALVSLVDAERQWFKAARGLAAQSTAREWAFCAHAIELQADAVMVVEDAAADPRFQNNPLVIGAPRIRFYAGAVLTSPAGNNLGTLCVIDTKPRPALTERQANCLRRLARIVVDELEYRRTLNILAEKQQLLDMAEQMSGVGRWRFDLASQRVTWSDEAFRIHGLPLEGGVPDYAGILLLYHEDDRSTLASCVARAVATGQGYEFEGRVRRPDGAVRDIVAKGDTLKGHDGRVETVFGVFQDVTETKAADREIRDKNDLLLKTCAEAEAAANAKAEFLANMSHELRTPLTAILGFAKLIEDQSGLPAQTKAYIGRVSRGGQALLSTVNDILDFSKLEAGQVEIKPRTVAISSVARNALDLFSLQAAEKMIVLETAGVDDLPSWLVIDPDRLQQVLHNFIGNAVKFTEAGSVRLEAGYDPVEGRLTMAVVDTGPGIAESEIGRLFQRFSQVDGSLTRMHGGTGLGLAISKGIVEAMGGQVGVESREGQGSRFWLSVPAAAIAADAQATLWPSKTSALPEGCRILLVDDNSANRALARAVLKPLQPNITEACDGFEAVATAQSMRFDVILMDLRMPGLDGTGATRRIRSEPGPNIATPIVAFSADVTSAYDRGLFDGAVAKPICAVALIAAIAEALEWPGQDGDKAA